MCMWTSKPVIPVSFLRHLFSVAYEVVVFRIFRRADSGNGEGFATVKWAGASGNESRRLHRTGLSLKALYSMLDQHKGTSGTSGDWQPRRRGNGRQRGSDTSRILRTGGYRTYSKSDSPFMAAALEALPRNEKLCLTAS